MDLPPLPPDPSKWRQISGLSDGKLRRREQGYQYAAQQTALPQGTDDDLLEEVAVEQTNPLPTGTGAVLQETAAEQLSEARPSAIGTGSVFANIMQEVQNSAPASQADGASAQSATVRPTSDEMDTSIHPIEAPNPPPEAAASGTSNDSVMRLDMTEVDPAHPWEGMGECFDERFTPDDRGDKMATILEAYGALKDEWNNTRAACETCSKPHPPPCNKTQAGKDFATFKKKAAKHLARRANNVVQDLAGSLSSDKGKGKAATDPAEPKEATGKKKRGSWPCRKCGRRHPGGAEQCKAPLCSNKPSCGFHHWERELCRDARKRMVEAGYASEGDNPAQKADKKSVPQSQASKDDNVTKSVALMGQLSAEDMAWAAPVLRGLNAGAKRAAEEEPEAEAERPSKKRPKKAKGKGKAKAKEESKDSDPSRRQDGDNAGSSKGPRGMGGSVYAPR